MKMWTVKIRDETAYSVQSDLDLHCPQKLVSSSVRIELMTMCRVFLCLSVHFHKVQFLDSSKLKKFVANNFEIDENGGKFSERMG